MLYKRVITGVAIGTCVSFAGLIVLSDLIEKSRWSGRHAFGIDR